MKDVDLDVIYTMSLFFLRFKLQEKRIFNRNHVIKTSAESVRHIFTVILSALQPKQPLPDKIATVKIPARGIGGSG
jgi:hypothetical protein